ncbi:MAG: hypothetical protein WBA28_02905 [Microbacteriaceae bacterium]
MRGKCLLLIGLGVGYYFGAKAGRSRYRQIRTVANKVWTSSPVQNTVEQAEGFVRGVAPDLIEKIEQGSRFVSKAVSGRTSGSVQKAPATRSQPKTTAPRSASASATAERKTVSKRSSTSKAKGASTSATKSAEETA